MHEELASSNELHHEEDLLLSLKDIVHAHQERVVRLKQDVLFQLGALDLIVINDDVFPE